MPNDPPVIAERPLAELRSGSLDRLSSKSPKAPEKPQTAVYRSRSLSISHKAPQRLSVNGQSERPVAARNASPIEERVVRRSLHSTGLECLHGPWREQAIPKGKTGRSGYRYGTPIGGYVVLSGFGSGQEPKFLAKKGWTWNDTKRLVMPGHDYCELGDAFILAQLRDTTGSENAEKFAKNADFYLNGTDDGYEDFKKEKEAQPPPPTKGEIVAAFLEQNGKEEVKRQAFSALKSASDTGGLVSNHVQATHDDFQRIYMLKLDFQDKDIITTLGGKQYVQKPLDRLKERYVKKLVKVTDKSGKEVWREARPDDDLKRLQWKYKPWYKNPLGYLNIAKKRFVELIQFKSRNDVNRGAATEALANAMLARLTGGGGVTQDLKIIPAQYEDGTPKLLLAHRFVGHSDVDGDPNTRLETFEHGKIQDGYLVKQDENGNPVDKNGERVTNDKGELLRGKTYVVDDSIYKLGENLFPNLITADVDAIGKRGANRGRIRTSLDGQYAWVNFDTGKAFDIKEMKSDIVGNDFSIRDTRRVNMGNFYTSYDLFMDTPLSEKMRGVKRAKDTRDAGDDAVLFEQYKETFDKKSGLDFRSDFENLHQAWDARLDRFLGSADGTKPGVFTERLKVYDFDYGTNDPVENDKRADQTFDILDNLEKLTSETSALSKKGKVKLNRPRILDGKRQEWHVRQDPNSKELVFRLNTSEGDNVRRRLNTFLLRNVPDIQKVDSQGFEFRIPQDKIQAFAAQMSNEAVMADKHP